MTGAAHVRKREECRWLVDEGALCIARVRSFAVSSRGDVIYPTHREFDRVDEREKVREIKSRCDLLWGLWIGGWLGTDRIIESDTPWHDVRIMYEMVGQ